MDTQRRSNGMSRIGSFFTTALFLTLSFIYILPNSDATAQVQNAGRGLTYVRSAWNLDPGHLIMYNYTRFFGSATEINFSADSTGTVTYWDVQAGFSLNYGITRNIELGFTPIIYQDTHIGDSGFNLIDDIFVMLKVGSYGKRGASINYGFDVGTRLPTGKIHNVVFEPYSAGKISFGVNTRFSFASDPLYPDEAFSAHLNVGYWNHNDVGQKLTQHPADMTVVEKPTQELQYGFGVIYPTDRFDFSAELTGTSFIQFPPETAYSQENSAFLSPKVRYKAYRWLAIDMSADFRVAGGKDNTVYTYLNRFTNIGNYPGWRLNLGARITLLPTSIYSTSERDLLMRKAETRRELFEQIIREQKETESAEDELERIKEERRKAERELDRLRKVLDNSKTSKKDDKKKSKDNENK